MIRKVVVMLILFFPSFGFSQIPNDLPADTLAKIGTQIISAKDFLERFELLPWKNKEEKNYIEYAKLEFLQSLIAEKLLASESVEKNLGTDQDSKNMQYSLERLFVRDELYKREVRSKVVITPPEIQTGINKFAFELRVEILKILSKKEGELLYKKITSSKNKLAALSRFKDSLYTPIDTITITFGSNDLALEEAAYSLAINELSRPIESQTYKTVMIRLLNKYSNPTFLTLSRPDQIVKVKNIIFRRKEDTLAAKTFFNVTGLQKAEVKKEMFLMLADSALNFVKADSEKHRVKDLYSLTGSDIDSLMNIFVDKLDSVFVMIKSGPMTFKEVLLGLKNNYVVFPTLLQKHFYLILNSNIKTVIQNELLARDGLKKNLQYSENVRHDISTWMDNRHSYLLEKEIVDSIRVSENEIEQEYQKDPTLYGATVLVNIREILVDSVNDAISLRKRIDAGEKIGDLAKKYSKRKEWSVKNGESGYIDVNKWGEVGMYASYAKKDSIIGPLRIKDGLTIFQVIDKKIIDDSIRTHFDDIRKQGFQNIYLKKIQKTFDRYVGTLAKKYNVVINEDNLRNLKTNTTNMVTYRTIGFGGRILAVPPVSPQTGWINEWKKQSQLNQ